MSSELFIILIGCFGVSGILFLSIILYSVFVEWKQKDNELDKDDLSPLKWHHWSLEEGEADDKMIKMSKGVKKALNKAIKRKGEALKECGSKEVTTPHPLDEVIKLSEKARDFKINGGRKLSKNNNNKKHAGNK